MRPTTVDGPPDLSSKGTGGAPAKEEALRLHQCDQGSADWYRLRLGVPTASEFDKIITSTGKLSAQSRAYAHRLAAERLLNRTLLDLGNMEWIERGKDLEPQAARMYEFDQDCRTLPVGFITSDCGRFGASPDRIVVNQPGAVEIKCPAPHTHLGYLVDGFGRDYFVQAQGQIYVADLEWVDRYSFHPEMPPALHRTHRDQEFIAKMAPALEAFCDMLEEIMEIARSNGTFVRAVTHA
jgi:hypothetical protein